MKFREFVPTAALRPYINCFWWFQEGEQTLADAELVVPDGCCEVILHLGTPVQRISEKRTVINPVCNFIGPLLQPYTVRSQGNLEMIAIRFYPHTVGLFFQTAPYELKNQVVDLELLWGSGAKWLLGELVDMPTLQQRIAILERFLLSKLLDVPPTVLLLNRIVQDIIHQRGQLKIETISAKYGMTTRYLELLFRRWIGLTPKAFSRIIQFQQTFQLQHQAQSLTELSYLANYTDQSHFIRACRQLTGLSPKQFFNINLPLHDHFTQSDSISYLYNFAD
ncbi:MAG: helix-turn-helix transcriptional regulator [Bacteroidota bacterium]